MPAGGRPAPVRVKGGTSGNSEGRPRGASDGRGAWGAAPDIDALREMLSNQPKTIELLGPEPGELHSQMITENAIEVIALVHETSLIYEIKIPLARGGEFPYGVGAEPGMKIAIGVETPEIQRPERSEVMGGGRDGGGGFPGGMGGGRGGMGGERGGERPEPPTPLEVWASIKRAASTPCGHTIGRTRASALYPGGAGPP